MLCYGHILLVILTVKKIVGTCYEKIIAKKNQKEFRVEKVIKKNDHKLYVKWKGYNSSFKSWFDKKHIT